MYSILIKNLEPEVREIFIKKDETLKLSPTAWHYLANGHITGILSGAKLKGKAKKYSSWYMRQIAKASFLAQKHGISNKLLLINSRWCRVWSMDDVRTRIILD